MLGKPKTKTKTKHVIQSVDKIQLDYRRRGNSLVCRVKYGLKNCLFYHNNLQQVSFSHKRN